MQNDVSVPSPDTLVVGGVSEVTVQVFYYYPDQPSIINPNWFLWREVDFWPRFPRLCAFLQHWTKHLDGPFILL